MSKPHGACIFCKLKRQMSKQHIIPDRVKVLLPRTETEHTNTRVHILRNQPIKEHSKVHQGHLGARRWRRVCKNCNEGWINSAEQQAFEFAASLITGEALVLDQTRQSKLALLASIIAVMIDVDDPEFCATPQKDRDYIYAEKQPPPTWQIFLGRIATEEIRWRHHGFIIGPANVKDNLVPNIHISTAKIGNLLLQAICSPAVQDEASISDALIIAEQDGLALIHPFVGTISTSNLPLHKPDSFDYIADAQANALRAVFPTT